MKKIITLLSIFFLFPLSVFAENQAVNVSIECPSEILKNTEITCSVKAKSEIDIVSVELNYKLPKEIEVKSSTIDPIWQGSSKANAFFLYTNKPLKNEISLGTINLISNKDLNKINLEVTKLIVGDSNFNERTIIDLENVNNVNNMEKESKKEEEEKTNIFKYVIIILIIGTIVAGFLIYKKTRSGKNEK